MILSSCVLHDRRQPCMHCVGVYGGFSLSTHSFNGPLAPSATEHGANIADIRYCLIQNLPTQSQYHMIQINDQNYCDFGLF